MDEHNHKLKEYYGESPKKLAKTLCEVNGSAKFGVWTSKSFSFWGLIRVKKRKNWCFLVGRIFDGENHLKLVLKLEEGGLDCFWNFKQSVKFLPLYFWRLPYLTFVFSMWSSMKLPHLMSGTFIDIVDIGTFFPGEKGPQPKEQGLRVKCRATRFLNWILLNYAIKLIGTWVPKIYYRTFWATKYYWIIIILLLLLYWKFTVFS